ncbi:MAG: hypothetical protein Q9208_004824 [Pyrenodesmia sp. 3 TL-2023]
MANTILLYEEDARPHTLPPPLARRERLQQADDITQLKVPSQVVDMFDVLQLVLDPLENQMGSLRQHRNMNGLLYKLKWFAVLFQGITSMKIFIGEERAAFDKFRTQVNQLLRKRGCHVVKDFQPDSCTMPGKPIMDLVMGVYFDARQWTTIGEIARHYAGQIG